MVGKNAITHPHQNQKFHMHHLTVSKVLHLHQFPIQSIFLTLQYTLLTYIRFTIHVLN